MRPRSADSVSEVSWPIARCPEPLRQMSYLDVSTWEADVAVNIRNFFAARFARGYAW